MKTTSNYRGLGMPRNTNSHNLVMTSLQRAIANRLPQQFNKCVACEVTVKGPSSDIEPDVSLWKHAYYSGCELQYEDLLLIVEIVHISKNRSYSTERIGLAFKGSATLKEAFMYDYDKKVWFKFLREPEDKAKKTVSSWSELLNCDLATILKEEIDQESALLENDVFRVDSECLQLFNYFKANLLINFGNLIRKPNVVQPDYLYSDPHGIEPSVTPVLSICEKASFVNNKLRLESPYLIVDMIVSTANSLGSNNAVARAMKYQQTIQEGFVFNCHTKTWYRLTRKSNSRNLIIENSDWCRTYRVHLNRFLAL